MFKDVFNTEIDINKSKDYNDLLDQNNLIQELLIQAGTTEANIDSILSNKHDITENESYSNELDDNDDNYISDKQKSTTATTNEISNVDFVNLSMNINAIYVDRNSTNNDVMNDINNEAYSSQDNFKSTDVPTNADTDIVDPTINTDMVDNNVATSNTDIVHNTVATPDTDIVNDTVDSNTNISTVSDLNKSTESPKFISSSENNNNTSNNDSKNDYNIRKQFVVNENDKNSVRTTLNKIHQHKESKQKKSKELNDIYNRYVIDDYKEDVKKKVRNNAGLSPKQIIRLGYTRHAGKWKGFPYDHWSCCHTKEISCPNALKNYHKDNQYIHTLDEIRKVMIDKIASKDHSTISYEQTLKQIRNELSHKHNIKAYKPVHTEREALYWQQRLEKQRLEVLHTTNSPRHSTVSSTVNRSTSSTGNKLQSEGIKDCDSNIIERLTKVFAIAITQNNVSIKDIFSHLDKDHSGYLDFKELENGLKSFGCFDEITPKEIESLMNHFDIDGNKLVSIVEFNDYFMEKIKEYSQDNQKDITNNSLEIITSSHIANNNHNNNNCNNNKSLINKFRETILLAESKGLMLEELFGILDDDGSTQISATELYRTLQTLSNFKMFSLHDIEELTQTIDIDKTGDVSVQEFWMFIKNREMLPTNIQTSSSPDSSNVYIPASFFLPQKQQQVSPSRSSPSRVGGGSEYWLPNSPLSCTSFNQSISNHTNAMNRSSVSSSQYTSRRISSKHKSTLQSSTSITRNTSLHSYHSTASLSSSLMMMQNNVPRNTTSNLSSPNNDQSKQINIVKVITNGNPTKVMKKVLDKNTSSKTLLDVTHSQKYNKSSCNTSNKMQQQHHQRVSILNHALDKIKLIASNPTSKLDFKSVFIQFDTSGDGYLTLSELSKALQVQGVHLDQPSMEALFKHFDPNNSGSVHYDEFVWAFYNRRSLLAQWNKNTCTMTIETINDMFRKADINQDGLLSMREFQHFLHSFGIKYDNEDDYKIIMNRFDRNYNGYINLNEFKAFINDESLHNKDLLTNAISDQKSRHSHNNEAKQAQISNEKKSSSLRNTSNNINSKVINKSNYRATTKHLSNKVSIPTTTTTNTTISNNNNYSTTNITPTDNSNNNSSNSSAYTSSLPGWDMKRSKSGKLQPSNNTAVSLKDTTVQSAMDAISTKLDLKSVFKQFDTSEHVKLKIIPGNKSYSSIYDCDCYEKFMNEQVDNNTWWQQILERKQLHENIAYQNEIKSIKNELNDIQQQYFLNK